MFKAFLAAGFVAILASGASATTLDFVAEAAGNERGVVDGTPIDFGGVIVTFSATGGSAYFDDVSGGPGGLGVCGTLSPSDQCIPSSDDNLTAGETVTLSFSGLYDFSGLTFHDADHNPVSASDSLMIAIDGGTLTSYTFGVASSTLFSSIMSITFGYAGTAYYVSSAVANASPISGPPPTIPLPAGAVLLLTALGGLGVAGARRKRA
jgi:hypothetical protein